MNNLPGPPSSARHAVRGMRLLLVDDNAYYTEATRFVVEHDGGIITLAHNGQQALDLLHRQAFDCVLMDMTMPVMDGIEAVTRIRADPAIARVRVIGMTGHLDRDAAARCIAAGMDDVITKPFEIETLYALLAQPRAK